MPNTRISLRKAHYGHGLPAETLIERSESHLILTEHSPHGVGEKADVVTEMTLRRVKRGPWSREDYEADEASRQSGAGPALFDEVQISVKLTRVHTSGRVNNTFGHLKLRGGEIDSLLGALAYTVPADPVHLARCSVKAERVDQMSRQEMADLMHWCDAQSESLWDAMSLQEILNVYRVSAEWDSWEGWAQEERAAARAAWDSAVIDPSNKMAPL